MKLAFRYFQWGAVVAGSFGLLTLGCTSASGAPETASDSALRFGEQLVSVETAKAELDVQLEEFRTSEIAFTECVKAKGFNYEPRRISVDWGTNDHLLTAAEYAQQFGFGVIDNDGSLGVSVSVDGGTVPEDEQATFADELSAGSCLDRYWNGDLQEMLFEMQSSADAALIEALMEDPRVADAMEGARRCLEDKGLGTSDPMGDIESAWADLQAQRSELGDDEFSRQRDELAQRERDMAVDQFECYNQVDAVLADVAAER